MRFTSLMTAAAVIAGSASLMQPAHAQFQEIIEGIGFGKDKEPIEYRERAPLVVPPNLNLRPPEERPIAGREAKWPNDPDVARKKAEDEEARKPRPTAQLRSNSAQGLLLSNEELRRGRVPGAELITGGPSASRNNNGYDIDLDQHGRINPDRLRAQGDAFRGAQEPALKPGEEPKRRYLTDPPVGMRAAAAGAPVVATAEKRGPDQNEESSPYAFFRRVIGDDD